jgi:hypothetical protein
MRLSQRREPLRASTASRGLSEQCRETRAHIDVFNNLVKYLVRLRRDGTLNDADFASLVRLASVAFIETEISDRVEQVLASDRVDRILLGARK